MILTNDFEAWAKKVRDKYKYKLIQSRRIISFGSNLEAAQRFAKKNKKKQLTIIKSF